MPLLMMRKLKASMKKSAVIIAFTILFVYGGVCTPSKEKANYIVHMAKSEMPSIFTHHSHWFQSTLRSVSPSAQILYSYDTAVHGFFTSLTAKEVQLLSNQTGILKISSDKKYQLFTTRSPQFLGLERIHATFPALSNRSMEEIIVGVIDTGVWPESKSFDDTGYGAIPSTWKGFCETSIDFPISSCNKKLIGARFYLKGFEADVGRPINETKETRSPRDNHGHGTHTASTAVGSPVGNASLFGYASGTARGMAPGARVAIYKVGWERGNVLESDIIAAIDQAIADKVNVLSLSIGFIALQYYEDIIAIGAFAAMEHGIMVSCAGGNSGPESSSITNVAPWITTVGASTIDRDFPAYITLGNNQNFIGVSLYNGSSLPETSVSFIYAGNASLLDHDEEHKASQCMSGSLAKEKVIGKIVMCESSKETSGPEQGNTVKSLGALGMVLVNFAVEGEELLAEPHVLPTIVVKFKDGEAIKKYLFSSDPNKSMAKIVSGGTKFGVEVSPVVAGFSSRGPNLITPQILKQDLIAPGVNILAAFTRNDSIANEDWDSRRADFNIYSGTSVACPHVSGIAALIMSIHPDWSPAAIRSALMTTAYPAYKNGKTLLDGFNKKPATPFDFGAGHVDPILALRPGLVYDLTVDDYLSFLCALNYSAADIETVVQRKYSCDIKKHYSVTNLNYPSFAVVFEERMEVVKHRRILTNVGAAGTYKVSVQSNASAVNVTVEPQVLRFEKDEKKSYVVTFTSTRTSSERDSFGSLEWSNENTVVRSPITFSWKKHKTD
ncbi:subtilisin-like protease SBT1.7 isoform X2 [Vicia villosa]|nr:subtilisin-like protease SBT1.7 isoform X2 [Vicia villosa]XP_058778042.1 subtilisin-like protease SBT1.7 isoform X2 [Vicia villosa]